LGKRTQKDDAASAAPDFEISSSKRQKMDDIDKPKWDPIKTVQSIFRDIREHNTEAPRSRFVSRMVPIQVTCFASMEEIMANATELIKDFLMPKVNALTKGLEDKLPSFKIEFKRRNCNHIRREQIVDGIANIVKDLTAQFWSNHSGEKTGDGSKPLFRVDLDNPDYTIIIELCRTLCGMSVVANTKSYKKFNLIVLQEESTAAHKAN
jgi:tRNA acetyltransferase TAN1